MQNWQCRVAPSLGELEGTHNEVWGTKDYADNFIDNQEPAVFFGIYGLPDFYALWRHKGRKAILWAGSDIIHFNNGYWLDGEGLIRIQPRELAEWVNIACESYVENEEEKRLLEMSGIESKVVPSFMGDVKEYDVSYEHSDRPKVYMSVSGDGFESYGWYLVQKIAPRVPEVQFHLFGSSIDMKGDNVHVRGRVPKEQMNEEIKNMQCGLRLNVADGFSEVTAKSILWGQHPIVRARFGYPHLDSFETEEELVDLLKDLKNKKEVNIEGRDYYLENLNQYPWNQK